MIMHDPFGAQEPRNISTDCKIRPSTKTYEIADPPAPYKSLQEHLPNLSGPLQQSLESHHCFGPRGMQFSSAREDFVFFKAQPIFIPLLDASFRIKCRSEASSCEAADLLEFPKRRKMKSSSKVTKK